MGCVAAIVFSSFGAAYGTAKASVGFFASTVLHPELSVRNLIPTVFAGILAIYGLVAAVLISSHISPALSLYTALVNLGSGLAVGLSALAAGFALGIVGDAGTRAVAQQPRLYVSMVLILIFAEVLGLYGLIVALLVDAKAKEGYALCKGG
ncbi:H(+)-transporting V0 sector ATPase subunit c [Teratosphaeriaceae sp. CCFEE 6253]|nr:H(+)-transporting V0 sector ATPase subunit c [Teratosphaeriaceae sp. CCFEE 6253]